MQIDPFSAKKITNKQNLTCIEKNSENLIKSLNPSTNTKMTVHKNQLYILYGAVYPVYVLISLYKCLTIEKIYVMPFFSIQILSGSRSATNQLRTIGCSHSPQNPLTAPQSSFQSYHAETSCITHSVRLSLYNGHPVGLKNKKNCFKNLYTCIMHIER